MKKTQAKRLVILHPDGKQETTMWTGKDFLTALYALINTDCVTRTEIKWEGKKRYVWLDDNGFAKGKPINPQIKPLAEAYWKVPCQNFVGVGVVELPA